ncbi:MAG: hypothetical protein HYX60_03560 [Legionella longbeachae]|nr:hypothetical protein [Legionella longbeachae]
MELSTQQIGKCKIVITEIKKIEINSINISVTTPPSIDIHEVCIENPILIKAIKYYIESGEFEYFLEILKECNSKSANTIASMLSKEFNSVLTKIAETVYDKTKELIPVAANKPDLKNWPSHRKLLMFLSRSRKLGLEDKERINNLKLFILENNEDPNFLAMRVKGKYFGIDNPSMLQILDIVTHLPDIDDKAFHKLKTNNPVILLSFNEKEIISEEYLSKIADEYSYFSPPIIIKHGKDYKIYGCNNGNWELHDLILEKKRNDNQILYQDLEKIQFPKTSSSPIFIDPEDENTKNKNVFPDSVYQDVKKNKYHSIGRPFLKSERVENTAKNSILSSIGNCRENSAIVEVLLGGYENNLNNEPEKYPDIGINKVIIERAAITPRGMNDGDHAYVLMNREQYRMLKLAPELKKDIQEKQILIGSHHLYIEPNKKGLYYFAKNMTEPKFIEKERLSLYELEYLSDKKLNPGVIEIKCITEGLQYRILDREGLEKNDIIPLGML